MNEVIFMTENDLATLGSIFLIEVDKIRPNSQQPRTEFDEGKLKDLSESIRQYGVLQPLVVIRKETETEKGISVEYELVAGERRLRASKLAGVFQVPVVIRKESDEKTKLELAIIENLQREDLNAIDRAMAFSKLAENFKLKHHEIATRVGKSREYVSNTIRLLMLPEEIQSGLLKGDIGEGHCRTLLALDGRTEEQIALYKDIVNKKMSVRLVEKITRNMVNGILMAEAIINPDLRLIERKLASTLGTKVHIEMEDGRGKISIDFFSDNELKNFFNRVVGGENGKEKNAENETSMATAVDNDIKSLDGILSPGTVNSSILITEVEKEKPEKDPVEEMLKNFSL